MGSDQREIRTERLVLREWREADRDPWAALVADPDVMRWFPSTLDRAAADIAFERISAGVRDRGWGLFALEHDRRFIGFTGLAIPGFDAPFMPAVEIGWRLARDAWGHGFATEAATAVLDLAFGEFGMPELVSFTTVGNVRSRAVMARLGMRHDPVDDFEHPMLPVGHPLRTHVLYRLAPTDRPPKSA